MAKIYEDDYRNASRDDIAASMAGQPWQASLGEIGKPFAGGGMGVPQNWTSQFAAPPVQQYAVPGVGAPITQQVGKARPMMGDVLQPLPSKRSLGGLQMQRMRGY